MSTVTPAPRLGRWRTAGALALVIAYGGPALLLVVTSFKSNDDVVNHVASVLFEPTLNAYRAVLDGQLLGAMWSSLQIAALATLVIMVVSVPAAYGLARLDRGQGLAIGVLVALQTVPLASFVIPMFQVLNVWGQLGTLRGVSLALSALATPFTILLLRPFFLAVPASVEEAAEVDGAGPLRIFLRVVLPSVRNGVLTVAALNFIHAWGEFLYSISLLNDPQKYPISALLSQRITLYGVQWNELMAIAMLTALPMLALFAMVARNLTAGIALGSGR